MGKEENEVDFSFFDEENFHQIQTILKDDIRHRKLPEYISNMGDTTLEEIAAMSTGAYGPFVLSIPRKNENDDIQFNAYVGKDKKNGYFFGLCPWVPEKFDGTTNVGILLAEKYENALGLRFPLDTFLQADYSDFESRMNLACSRFMDVLNRQYPEQEESKKELPVMRYDVQGSGSVFLKNPRNLDLVESILKDRFSIAYAEDDFIEVSCNPDYRWNEEDVNQVIRKAEPYLKDVSIRFEGEDGRRWITTLDGTASGEIYYPKIAEKNLKAAGFSKKDVEKIMSILPQECVIEKKKLAAQER